MRSSVLREVTGPRRRLSDHSHDEYWETSQQHRYEDRMAAELKGINDQLRSLTLRITLIMGAIGILAFVIPIVAPFIRSALGVPNQ